MPNVDFLPLGTRGQRLGRSADYSQFLAMKKKVTIVEARPSDPRPIADWKNTRGFEVVALPYFNARNAQVQNFGRLFGK